MAVNLAPMPIVSKTLTDRVGAEQCASILAQSFMENEGYDDFPSNSEEGDLGRSDLNTTEAETQRTTSKGKEKEGSKKTYADYEADMAPIEEPDLDTEGKNSDDELEQDVKYTRSSKSKDSSEKAKDRDAKSRDSRSGSSRENTRSSNELPRGKTSPRTVSRKETPSVQKKTTVGLTSLSASEKKTPSVGTREELSESKTPGSVKKNVPEIFESTEDDGQKGKDKEKKDKAHKDKDKEKKEKKEDKKKEKGEIKFRLSRKYYSAATAMSAPKPHRSPAIIHMIGDKQKKKIPKVSTCFVV